MAARSKEYVWGRLVAGIAGSNPALGMDACLLCLYIVLSCVGRGLCDGLITRPEESYRSSNCMWLRNLNKEEDKAQVWAVVPYHFNCRVTECYESSATLLLNFILRRASILMDDIWRVLFLRSDFFTMFLNNVQALSFISRYFQ
jgi:hypothetical protein